MTIQIRVNAASTNRLLRRLEVAVDNEANFRASRGIIMRRTVRQIRDDIKQKLLTGGGGRWKRLSAWTTARTGRTTPLSPLAGRIKERYKRGRAEIYFDAPSPEWSLTSHHKGFGVSATTNTFMRVPQLLGPAITFRNRRAYAVPARPVWPSERAVLTILNRNVRAFIAHIERGSSTSFGPSR